MFAWFNDLLVSTSNFMPHGACYLWLPSILWLHVISDTLIALAYYSIPFALFYFVKKRIDLAYRWVFVLFAAFIFLCGTTHLISIWTIWHPDYWLDGLIKLATALVSIVTASLIWPLIPKLLRLPSPQALQNSESYLRAIYNATPDAMLISDEHGIITMVNQQAERLLGYPIDELVGLSIEVLVPGRHRANHRGLRAQFASVAVARPMGAGRTVQAQRKDGSFFDVDISVSPIKTDQGLFFASALRDVTLRKQADAHLRIAAIAFESNEPMVITDANNIILQVNQAFTKSTGYTKEEAVGQKINLLKSGRHGEAFYKAIWETIERTGTWQGEIWDRRKNGEIYPKWLIISVVKGDDGVATHYVGTHIDITERKAAEEQIKQLAFYDPLTQLPNRRLLQERLKHGIDVERRDGKQLALLMLDLDRFKSVNDSMGHLAGDELLQQVAERITSRLREVDMVARLGGDEFIVLLEDIAHPEDAARVAEDIITDLSKPFCMDQGEDIQISASIGISLYPQHGGSPQLLMDHADAALYQAKDAGRGCFAYFSEDLTIAARERIALELRLRKAIEQQDLRVFYQPQVDIASGRIVGAEALVRWQDPAEGLIPPIRFIPIAEETGLILAIGEWVLRETCRQGRQWLDAGLPPLNLAVNVSPHQFRRSDICSLVAKVLSETGFPANQLELEITESGLMENQGNATEILNGLRDQGIRLAIDDFGTGYSSLAYLKHFPLDLLKIDKSFIDDIPHLEDDMEIASSIIAMGHILGFKVLAEGVETPEQLAFLQEKGCDMYQGYIQSRPVPAEEFAEFLGKMAASVD
jgi:diguanylate cyclase (GGDEF)-like protein/PAS domain S-box-containing protein